MNILNFAKSYILFRNQAKLHGRFVLRWKDRYPVLHEDTSNSDFDSHYVYHTSWASRVLAMIRPDYHIDISSDLRFATLASAFVPMKYYDYRPPAIKLDGLETDFADLMNLPFENECIPSLSCMHVVEHIGLARYGDSLDYNGDLKAISELKRVLARGGDLLFVVPIGKPKIIFNAHRIYSYSQVVDSFSGFELIQFALVTDSSEDNELRINATKEMADLQDYGCGCFWFRKKDVE